MPPGMEGACYNFLTRYGAMLRHDVLKQQPIHEHWCEEHPHDPCSQSKRIDKAVCALFGSRIDGGCVGSALRRRFVRAGLDMRSCGANEALL